MANKAPLATRGERGFSVFSGGQGEPLGNAVEPSDRNTLVHSSPAPSIILPSALNQGALPFSARAPLPEAKQCLPQSSSQTPHHGDGDALGTPCPACLYASLAGAWHASPHHPTGCVDQPALGCHLCDPQHRHHPLALPWAHLHGARGA